jgi:tRNA(Ile)-lysidine synthase
MPRGEDSVDWMSAVAGFKERHPDPFVPEVEAFLKSAHNRRVLVACSGGADSVFLLLALIARNHQLRLDCVVAHYNHRWRGEASDADAAFVEQLAIAFDLPFVSESRPAKEAAFTETTARALRLDFLRQAAFQHACSCVVFGHQMDDILETQLQRIARGSGTDGLAAPRPIARFANLPPHVRPLLDLKAVDIRMALNSVGARWREDRSNEDLSIARNALRYKVIPDLHDALDRDPRVGAARSRRILEEDAVALNHLAKQLLPAAFDGKMALPRAALQAAPRALTRRALLAWLNGHGLLASVGAPAMDLLLNEVYSATKKHQVSAGAGYILIEGDLVYIRMESEPFLELSTEPEALALGTPTRLATGAFLELSVVELDARLQECILGGQIDPSVEAYFLVSQDSDVSFRGWRAGDRFLPIGAPGTKKLKDWFIDRHIPKKERKQLPVVINRSGEIIWVPGFPPADRLKIGRDTKRALRLTYRTRDPTSSA